jgi:hypothetical protein
MSYKTHPKSEAGFSILELLVAILILLPAVGAALILFSVGTAQQVTEQGSIDVNQEARAGLEMITREISQAGAQRDMTTNITSPIVTPDATNPQTVHVASTAGMLVGDYVDVDAGARWESVQLTAVTSNSISAIFNQPHDAGAPVNLFTLPYAAAVIPPAGMAANSSVQVTTLKFFGDIDNDNVLDYIEYSIGQDPNATTDQITRSVTPVTAADKNPALPFINDISPGSAQFTVNTNELGAITSVNIALTVENKVAGNIKTENDLKQQAALASTALIPSAMAASRLLIELQQYQDINRLPQTPPQIITWATQYEN